MLCNVMLFKKLKFLQFCWFRSDFKILYVKFEGFEKLDYSNIREGRMRNMIYVEMFVIVGQRNYVCFGVL